MYIKPNDVKVQANMKLNFKIF